MLGLDKWKARGKSECMSAPLQNGRAHKNNFLEENPLGMNP